MKKNSIILLSGLVLLSACGGDSQTESDLIQFPDADKSEVTQKNSQTEPMVTEPKVVAKTTTIEYMETEHDFGDIFYPSDNKYTFKFKNTGTEPLIISDAKASCGCTVPRKPEQPVMPGEIGEMDVVFKPKENQIGQTVTKRVTITANTEPQQTFLDIKAKVNGGM